MYYDIVTITFTTENWRLKKFRRELGSSVFKICLERNAREIPVFGFSWIKEAYKVENLKVTWTAR